MLKTLLKWIVGAAILGSLFWCSNRECVALLLTVWTVAIGIFVYSNLADRFLWIPVLLALFGVFGSILVLAIPANIILAGNMATLILFAISLEVLKDKRHSSIAVLRHRAW
jgi:hypothetical protein